MKFRAPTKAEREMIIKLFSGKPPREQDITDIFNRYLLAAERKAQTLKQYLNSK